MIRKLVVLVGLVVTMTGCVSVHDLPPLNFSVPEQGVSEKKLDAEVKSITVTVAGPEDRKGKIDMVMAETSGFSGATGGSVTRIWHTALEEALNRILIFSDDGRKKVSILVKILRLETPHIGVEIVTQVSAKYEIIDRATGDIIYADDIDTIGKSPFSDNWIGFVRARTSINRAIQKNISNFIRAIESVDIDKPMFPVRR